jgi:D-amino-acid dehydrogenase
VTIVERGPAGHDCCSLGNAGYISPSHFVPLAAPGIVGQALRWVGDPESPFYVRLRPDPGLLSWGWRFWRASSPERARRAGPLLRDLNLASRALFVELAERTRNEFELTQEGLLTLFQTERALHEEIRHAERARELGMPAEVLDARGARALEPELTMNTVGGVHYPLDAHLTPHRFHASMTRLARDRGGEFLMEAELKSWRRVNGGSIRAAVTTRGEVEADEFVVAAGWWSSRAVRPLGVRLPLQPGKGYSLTLPAPRERPRRAVLLQENRVAITPMGTSLRVGGTMELGASDGGINPPRIRGIVRSLVSCLPAFRVEDFNAVTPWSGLRPCTPDGLPYVGKVARIENLSVAAGHAMMGLSMGPITGKLIAESLSGDEPSIDMTPLRPDRYA